MRPQAHLCGLDRCFHLPRTIGKSKPPIVAMVMLAVLRLGAQFRAYEALQQRLDSGRKGLMKTVKRCGLACGALILLADLGSSQVRLLPASTKNKTISARGHDGRTQLAARESRVELKFAPTREGKGSVVVIFDHSTGYYFSFIYWDKDYANRSLLEGFTGEARVGVTDEKLVIFTLRSGVLFAYESTDKASSIDDAEVKTLQWATEHIAETESRADRYKPIRLGEIQTPPDFLLARPPGSAMIRSGPDGLLDLERHDGLWELTVQGQYKGKLLIDDHYLSHGFVRDDENSDRKKKQ
jgi:hypothetical protein